MDQIYIIKDRLNEALKRRGMTAAALAKATGINKSSISRYLSGASIPRSLAIGKIAQALHVNPAWVLGYNVGMDLAPGAAPVATDLEIYKLTPENQTRLLAYYQALIDSQDGAK